MDINYRDSSGMSPLHHSTLTGNARLTEILLQHGCDVDITDSKGLRPLHYAAWKGQDELVDLLCMNGSAVNTASLDGTTPLHLASEHGHCSAVERLLCRGADPAIVNKRRRTALDSAAEFGRTLVVQLLLLYVSPAALQASCSCDVSGTTCLHLAARNGHADVIRLLLHAGLDVNLQTNHGTCLHEAAMFGRTDVVRMLLSCGADVNCVDSYEQTPLDIVNKYAPTSAAARDIKIMLRDYCRAGSNWSVMQRQQQQQQQRNQPQPKLQYSQTFTCGGQSFEDARRAGRPSMPVSATQSFGSNGSLLHNNRPLGHLQQHMDASPSSSCNSSQASLDQLLQENGSSGYGTVETVDVRELIRQGVSDVEVMQLWLSSLHLADCWRLFVDAGYDMPTVSRMTPEDLTAIGITSPSIRKRLRAEINNLDIDDRLPHFKPRDVNELLRLLGLDEYSLTLSRQGYNELESLVDITWEDLEDIGIRRLGHQKKMMLAVERLKKLNDGRRRIASCSDRRVTPQASPLLPPGSFHLAATSCADFTTGRSPYETQTLMRRKLPQLQQQQPHPNHQVMSDPQHQRQRYSSGDNISKSARDLMADRGWNEFSESPNVVVPPPPQSSDIVAISVSQRGGAGEVGNSSSSSREKQGRPVNGNSDAGGGCGQSFRHLPDSLGFRSPDSSSSDADRTPTNDPKSTVVQPASMNVAAAARTGNATSSSNWRPSAKVLPSLKQQQQQQQLSPTARQQPANNGIVNNNYMVRRVDDYGGEYYQINGTMVSAYGTLPRKPVRRQTAPGGGRSVNRNGVEDDTASEQPSAYLATDAVWMLRRNLTGLDVGGSGGGRRREPPPAPPRRSDSFKTADQQQQQQQAAVGPAAPTSGKNSSKTTTLLSNHVIQEKVAVDSRNVTENRKPEQPTPTAAKPVTEKSDKFGVTNKPTDVSKFAIKEKVKSTTVKSDQSTSPLRGDPPPPPPPLSRTVVNGDAAKSPDADPAVMRCCSPGSDSILHFANENVGTLKLQRAAAGTAATSGSTNDSSGSADFDEADAVAGPFDNDDFDTDTIKRAGGGGLKMASKCASNSIGGSNETLFGDIDVMLVGLAAELEQMLNMQPVDK